MRLFDPEDPAGTAPPPPEADGAPEDDPPAGDTARAAPPGPLSRVRFLVAYDGSAFHGFALQPDQETVAGRLVAALGRVTGRVVELTCAGRTDTGVHAAGQVVHADLPAAFLEAHPDLARLAASLTHQVGPEVAVLDAALAAPAFDARRSALARRYRYLFLRSPAPDPLLRHMSWHVPFPLDLAAMRMAADALLGEHDFSAFCRRPPGGGSLVRRVLDVSLAPGADARLLAFGVEASSFCHQMVRSLAGALVSVGEGRMSAADVHALLGLGERARGARLAPPEGLCLVSVRYPEELLPGGTWLPPGPRPVA